MFLICILFEVWSHFIGSKSNGKYKGKENTEKGAWDAKNTYINGLAKAGKNLDIEIDPETGKPEDDLGRTHFLRTCRYIIRASAPMFEKRKWADISEEEKNYS
ncbi:hypothetical protein ACLOJK_038383 [Asimina triloba]